MDVIERLERVLADRGAARVFRLGDVLLWEGSDANHMASAEEPFLAEDRLVVHNLTPEQAAMATLGGPAARHD